MRWAATWISSRTYHGFGVRYLGLLHNGHNDLGDSAVPYPRLKDSPTEHGGLTDFGRAAVGRANDLGIIVDISHAAMTTALDAIRASRAPVIASHSSVKGVYEHPRNLSDEALDSHPGTRAAWPRWWPSTPTCDRCPARGRRRSAPSERR